jgi:hypothetical protein
VKSPHSTTGTSPSSALDTRPPSPCSRSRREPAVLLQYAGAGRARAPERYWRSSAGRRVGVAHLGERPHPRGGATDQALGAGRVHHVGYLVELVGQQGPYRSRVTVADRPRRGSRPRPGPGRLTRRSARRPRAARRSRRGCRRAGRGRAGRGGSCGDRCPRCRQ